MAPVITMEGKRPLLVEVQALVTHTSLPVPKRVASGLDQRRFTLNLAVLEKRAGLNFFDHDVFTGTAGGLHIVEPACDLAICLAVASSRLDRPAPPDLAVFGEVGLAGEVRPVSQMEVRVREAQRLGFKRMIAPDVGELPSGGRGFELIGSGISAPPCAPAALASWARGSKRLSRQLLGAFPSFSGDFGVELIPGPKFNAQSIL